MKQKKIIITALTLLITNPLVARASGTDPVFSQHFSDFNPASRFNAAGTNLPSQIIGVFFPFALILAGLLLLVMLVMGGFTMLSNPSNPQGQEAGKQRITWAIVGFFVLFMSYWLMQILQVVFGIRVVS